MTFIALEEPVYYEYNSTYSTHFWEVRGDTTEPGYWRLYTNCILYDGNVNNSPNGVSNLFDSECDAHRCAFDYYKFHGEDYPYMAEWHAALNREHGTGTVEPESEVMEFA